MVPFHQNCETIVKSAVFEAENPLEMDPDLNKFREKKNTRQISHFLREKKS